MPMGRFPITSYSPSWGWQASGKGKAPGEGTGHSQGVDPAPNPPRRRVDDSWMDSQKSGKGKGPREKKDERRKHGGGPGNTGAQARRGEGSESTGAPVPGRGDLGNTGAHPPGGRGSGKGGGEVLGVTWEVGMV